MATKIQQNLNVANRIKKQTDCTVADVNMF